MTNVVLSALRECDVIKLSRLNVKWGIPDHVLVLGASLRLPDGHRSVDVDVRRRHLFAALPQGHGGRHARIACRVPQLWQHHRIKLRRHGTAVAGLRERPAQRRQGVRTSVDRRRVVHRVADVHALASPLADPGRGPDRQAAR